MKIFIFLFLIIPVSCLGQDTIKQPPKGHCIFKHKHSDAEDTIYLVNGKTYIGKVLVEDGQVSYIDFLGNTHFVDGSIIERIHYENGKAENFYSTALKPLVKDTLKKHWSYCVSMGINIPGGNYGLPNNLYLNTGPLSSYYCYSDIGVNINGTLIYMLSPRIGYEIRLGAYLNQVYLGYPQNDVYQAMAGLCLPLNHYKLHKASLCFIMLAGLTTASVYNSDNNYFAYGPVPSINGSTVLGFGNGLGIYIGLTSLFRIGIRTGNVSIGYLIAPLTFHNAVTTTIVENIPSNNGLNSYSTTTITSGPISIPVNALEITFGIDPAMK